MSDTDAVPVSELARIAQHIRALAVVHDLLALNAGQAVDDAGASVPAEALVEKMLPMLAPIVGRRPFDCEIADIRLAPRQASALAVILSELVSNAGKHGSGGVRITLRLDGGLGHLEVCDDGPGFGEGFDARAAAKTGLALVERLGRWDLQGDVLYGNGVSGGARVVVKLPLVASAVGSSG